jgi:Bacteriophage related domain of unknown function
MASKAVKDAIEARVAAWPNLASCPLVQPNDDSATSPAQKFLEIEYPVSVEDRISLGSPGLFREHGVVRFVINVLTLDGIDQALTWVDELRDLFREYQAGTLTMQEASPAEFDAGNQVNARYQVPFVVPYQFDYQK